MGKDLGTARNRCYEGGRERKKKERKNEKRKKERMKNKEGKKKKKEKQSKKEKKKEKKQIDQGWRRTELMQDACDDRLW
jgi:hypothetical protein